VSGQHCTGLAALRATTGVGGRQVVGGAVGEVVVSKVVVVAIVVSTVVVVSTTVVVVSTTVVVVSVVGGSVGGMVGGSVGAVVGSVVGGAVVVGRGGRGGLVVPDVVGEVVPESGLLGAAVGVGSLMTAGSGLMRSDVVPWATTPARTAALTGLVVATPVVLELLLVVVLAGAVTENVNGAKTGATSVRTSSSECEPGMVVSPAVSSVLTLTPSPGLFGNASPTTPAPNSAAAAPKAQSTRLRVLGSPSSSSGCWGAGSESGGSKTGG
jgi:hypothetical protein